MFTIFPHQTKKGKALPYTFGPSNHTAVFLKCYDWVTKVELVKLLLSFKDIVVTYNKNNKVVTKITQPNISLTSYFKRMLSFEPWY